MAEGIKQMLAKPIQLADQVIKSAGEAHNCRQECLELKFRAEKLVTHLRQAARAELYERPARRIMVDTGHALEKALALADKCRSNGVMRRLFTIIPTTAFAKAATLLDNSITDVSWLLRVSSPSAADGDDDDQLHGLPPIAQNEPILFLIWEHIAKLHTGSIDERCDSAGALVSLARDNAHFGKLIIQEDGVGPLIRLLKEGRTEGQENAARALGLLGRDAESVDHLVNAGVCSAFAKVLKDGTNMRVQSVVAWAVAELAANQPKCQDVFAQNNAVRLLVVHLSFETIEDHSKYTVPSKSTSIQSVVRANKANIPTASSVSSDDGYDQSLIAHPMGKSKNHSARDQFHSVVRSATTVSRGGAPAPVPSPSPSPSPSLSSRPRQPSITSGSSHHKSWEAEDPSSKANMKAMASKALRYLAQGNVGVCKSITESRALLCFAALLEKGTGDVRYNSAMALMEIACIAEQNHDLRHSAFKPNSPAAKAVVDNLLQIVEKGEFDELLIPSITALGCLSRTFRATEKRIIGPLVLLLDEKDAAVAKAAVLALIKFACTENYLHVSHCQAFIDAGGTEHLVPMVYVGEQVQIDALVLLCYLAKHVPESTELAKAGAFSALLWASKQVQLLQDKRVETLLPDATMKMELYQPKSS